MPVLGGVVDEVGKGCCCGRLISGTARVSEVVAAIGGRSQRSLEEGLEVSVADVVVGVLDGLGSAIRRQPLPLFLIEEEVQSSQSHNQNWSSQEYEGLCTVGHYQT